MNQLLLYFTVFVSGLFIATWFGRGTNGFRWSEYIALLIFPTLAILWLIKINGIKVFYIYILSLISGTLIEYLVGWAYHKAEGKRLWYYERYALRGGYTSLLSMPIWGNAGIFFFLLVKAFGI